MRCFQTTDTIGNVLRIYIQSALIWEQINFMNTYEAMNPTEPVKRNIPKLAIAMMPKYIIVDDTYTIYKWKSQQKNPYAKMYTPQNPEL